MHVFSRNSNFWCLEAWIYVLLCSIGGIEGTKNGLVNAGSH